MAVATLPPNNSTDQNQDVTHTVTIDLTIETGVNGGKTTGRE